MSGNLSAFPLPLPTPSSKNSNDLCLFIKFSLSIYLFGYLCIYLLSVGGGFRGHDWRISGEFH